MQLKPLLLAVFVILAISVVSADAARAVWRGAVMCNQRIQSPRAGIDYAESFIEFCLDPRAMTWGDARLIPKAYRLDWLWSDSGVIRSRIGIIDDSANPCLRKNSWATFSGRSVSNVIRRKFFCRANSIACLSSFAPYPWP